MSNSIEKSPNAPLVRTLRVTCSIERAFHLFTAEIDRWWPIGHRRFQGSHISLEAKVGGRFVEQGDSGEEAVLGEIVNCEAPYHLSYTWYPGALIGPTLVDVRFTAEEHQTLVEIIHSEGESGMGDVWLERVDRFAKAWGEVLPAFAAMANE